MMTFWWIPTGISNEKSRTLDARRLSCAKRNVPPAIGGYDDRTFGTHQIAEATAVRVEDGRSVRKLRPRRCRKGTANYAMEYACGRGWRRTRRAATYGGWRRATVSYEWPFDPRYMALIGPP
ncbi:hypothetical protein B296_00029440 [Ensete ventricosum]|uniref:Uncharacterized protein n=1 Tax=Ensete ventricosum TaxID=4639 RepID=A0A427AK07_ENSVE|nr:hypothetical protein B296_00029440 [Ensete ventricosum]